MPHWLGHVSVSTPRSSAPNAILPASTDQLKGDLHLPRGSPGGLHPKNWLTRTATPAHAPKLSATAPQRRMVERQSIEFMAPPMQAPMRYFLNMLPGSAEQQKCHMRFSPGYPRRPQDVERAAPRLRGSRGPEEQSDPSQSNLRYPAPSTACPLLALTAGDRSTETVDIFVDKLRSDAQRGRNCYVATELPKI